jgi:hypothetical protein
VKILLEDISEGEDGKLESTTHVDDEDVDDELVCDCTVVVKIK